MGALRRVRHGATTNFLSEKQSDVWDVLRVETSTLGLEKEVLPPISSVPHHPLNVCISKIEKFLQDTLFSPVSDNVFTTSVMWCRKTVVASTEIRELAEYSARRYVNNDAFVSLQVSALSRTQSKCSSVCISQLLLTSSAIEESSHGS